MAMNIEELEALILKNIPDAIVQIEDLRGDGDHYSAHVISSAFIGKSRVEQHRMVYDALEGKLTTKLHALALQTAVPESEA